MIKCVGEPTLALRSFIHKFNSHRVPRSRPTTRESCEAETPGNSEIQGERGAERDAAYATRASLRRLSRYTFLRAKIPCPRVLRFFPRSVPGDLTWKLSDEGSLLVGI